MFTAKTPDDQVALDLVWKLAASLYDGPTHRLPVISLVDVTTRESRVYPIGVDHGESMRSELALACSGTSTTHAAMAVITEVSFEGSSIEPYQAVLVVLVSREGRRFVETARVRTRDAGISFAEPMASQLSAAFVVDQVFDDPRVCH